MVGRGRGRGRPIDFGELIPRLQRFFGGEPESWLQMRGPIFRAYAEMLPRLQAEEALAAISQGSAAVGTMPKNDRSRYMTDLRRHLAPVKPVRPRSLGQLAQMGVHVVVTDA